MSNYTTRAERVDFQLAPGYFLEFYRFPSGEKRIGITSAAVICGHKKNYFSRLQSATPKQWGALQGMGFTGYTVPCTIGRNAGSGSSVSQTLSLEDFRSFVRFSAFELGKKPALAIANALMGIAIETVARQAFGEESLQDAEIRHYFYKEFAKTINWLQEDREDARLIDEHMLFTCV